MVTINSGDVLIGGDLTVVGDFIQGSSTVFDSTTVNIGDNLITLNIVVVPSGGIRLLDLGLFLQDILSTWQEHRDRWEADLAV